MSKIKILQVVGSLKIGGKQKIAISIQKYLDKTNFQFHYLVFGNEVGELESEVKEMGGEIIRINNPKNNYIKFYNQLNKVLVEKGPYDVVHSHTLFSSGIVMKAAFSKEVPRRISHSHSAVINNRVTIFKSVYKKIMRHFLKLYSTDYIACSISAGSYLYGDKWFHNYGEIFKNGIDLNKYIYNAEERFKIRHGLNIHNNFVIGHVGRLSAVKNQNFIIEVFKEVVKNNDRALLLLIGDGEYRGKLEKSVNKLNLTEKVLFLGSRNDVPILLQGIDLFLFPSKHEGLGIALIEAQAAGVKCITSDTIPEETIMTNLVEKLPLNLGKYKWAERINSYGNSYLRRNTHNEIYRKGYDIMSSVQKIGKLYLNT